MIRRPPRSTLSSSSAASDVYKRQVSTQSTGISLLITMPRGAILLILACASLAMLCAATEVDTPAQASHPDLPSAQLSAESALARAEADPTRRSIVTALAKLSNRRATDVAPNEEGPIEQEDPSEDPSPDASPSPRDRTRSRMPSSA
eukprot:TRINITY_DN49767_c0_g1_i1.p2 TRINITY_DN49767_c0_g1~~TRINITY_DN49767_c0_g1_i1.p2  ORF type:complete len:147 (+),score=31.34 TRINITY_DN49767_c0_g1_i1:89-529(+)